MGNRIVYKVLEETDESLVLVSSSSPTRLISSHLGLYRPSNQSPQHTTLSSSTSRTSKLNSSTFKMSGKGNSSSSSTNYDPLLKHSSALGILKPGIVFSSSGGYGSGSSSSSSSGFAGSSSSKTSGGSSYTSSKVCCIRLIPGRVIYTYIYLQEEFQVNDSTS